MSGNGATGNRRVDDEGSEELVQPVRENGRYRNPWPGSEPATFRDFLRWQVGRRIRQEIVRGPRWPRLEPAIPALIAPRARHDQLLATWIGHSTVLLQIAGLNVLTDPIWSLRASPVKFAGPRRMTAPGMALEELPPIDIGLISHDHYDHLDDRSVRRLTARYPDAQWIVPLGLREFLKQRGANRVEELGWWETRRLGEVTLTGTPAQHHSARGLGDRGRSLWCGWTIAGEGRAVFFAGDTAYHPEFAVIGRRLGPFDLTILPIGAYEPRWFMRSVHMNPDEAVRAHLELTADGSSDAAMLGIHWGTFRMTDEPPDEPPARTHRAWLDAGLAPEHLWVLRHGETRERPPRPLRER